MIRLVRIRSASAIPEVFRGQKRVDKALTLLVGPGMSRAFDSDYWKKAKTQLRAETHDKCAYCEASTAVVAHGDVEHFRPKSVYWWLAYCYDNYLFACQLCNQSFKGNEFPLEDELRRLSPPVLPAGATAAQQRAFVRRFAPDPLSATEGMSHTEFEQAIRGEGASLLNPYWDDPEPHFAWEADEALQEVAVKPNGAAAQRFHQAAERLYGLNRPELLLERWKTFHKLDLFRRSLLSPDIDSGLRNAIRQMIREMTADDAPFAGMCRYFVHRVWTLHL